MLTDIMIYSSDKRVHYCSAIRDTCCGVYPVFYYVNDNFLVASSSAAELIKHKESFVENKEIKLVGGNWSSHPDSHDIEVKRLLPLHIAYPKRQKFSGELTPTIKDPKTYLKLQAKLIQKWINQVEEEYGPETFHVCLTGGIDSLIILLAQKKFPNMWIAFSGAPNAVIVAEFIKLNCENITLIADDGEDDETEEFIKRKIIATDGLVNPPDFRYFQRLESVIDDLGKVVFWTGCWGDALNAQTVWKKGTKNDYEFWKFFYTRGSRWQGAYHQAFRNLLNVPCFSAYHSPELWNEVFTKFDTGMIKENDLRPALGELIARRKIIWPNKNPGPKPYSRQNMTLEQIKKIYLEGMK